MILDVLAYIIIFSFVAFFLYILVTTPALLFLVLSISALVGSICALNWAASRITDE